MRALRAAQRLQQHGASSIVALEQATACEGSSSAYVKIAGLQRASAPATAGASKLHTTTVAAWRQVLRQQQHHAQQQHQQWRHLSPLAAAALRRPQQQQALACAAAALHTSAAARDAIQVVVPPMGDSITEGTIAAVLKRAGESVGVDEVIAQIETDKVTIDVKAPAAGAVGELLVKEGDTVVVGQAVARVDAGAAGSAPAAAAAAPAAAAPKPAAAAAPPPPPKPAAAPAAAPAAPAAASPGDKPPPRPERRVKMTRLRMRVSERLKGAQNTYAMLTTFNEVDMSGLMELRARYKDAFVEAHGVKLGFMSAFVKAAAAALQEVPAVNAVIDGNEIVYRDYVDVSIAVATPKGLVVPVLRNADALDFADVERTINELGRKARDGTISIDEMAGGTFTISNGGVYGSLFGTPIINPPQSAILGMHSIVQRPVVTAKGAVEARPMMYVALTYDHRLIDGREAVTFLKRIKDVVEDPRRLLLGV